VTTPPPQTIGFAPTAELRLLLDSIRVEHTTSALPLAHLSLVPAARAYASSSPATNRSSSRSSQ
jgi:hypothetical protein